MKFQFHYISDLHLERLTRSAPKFPRCFGRKIPLFLAGDIGYTNLPNYADFLARAADHYDRVFLITGNHEYDLQPQEVVDERVGELAHKIGNISFLNRSAETYGNVMVAGATLWHARHPRHAQDVTFIESAALRAKRLGVPLVVMTHHLPSRTLIEPHYARHPLWRHVLHLRATPLDHLICPPIIAWICGHSHTKLQQTINGVPVFINAHSSSTIQEASCR